MKANLLHHATILNRMFPFVSQKIFARRKPAFCSFDRWQPFFGLLSWLVWTSAAIGAVPEPVGPPLEPSPGFLAERTFREGYPKVFVNGEFKSDSHYELTNSAPAHITIQSSYPEIHFTTNGTPADILSDIYTGEFLIRPGVVINGVPQPTWIGFALHETPHCVQL